MVVHRMSPNPVCEQLSTPLPTDTPAESQRGHSGRREHNLLPGPTVAGSR